MGPVTLSLNPSLTRKCYLFNSLVAFLLALTVTLSLASDLPVVVIFPKMIFWSLFGNWDFLEIPQPSIEILPLSIGRH